MDPVLADLESRT